MKGQQGAEVTSMKCLIVEDDRVSCHVLEKMISRYGTYDVVDNGQKAVDLFRQAHESNCSYDLILMDIMMPEIDGLKSVLTIRGIEALMKIPLMQRVTVIMTTVLDDPRTVMKALHESDADSYLVKPIRLQKLEEELLALKLIPCKLSARHNYDTFAG
jgi:two-component system, chemotaxis family, chemotaxis protein CheY